VLADERLAQILPYIDTLVEGPFIESLRTTELPFRGSSNQRIIHIKDTK
jgi:anaerobic ribonucleoside-triphosphate reductase activating protein